MQTSQSRIYKQRQRPSPQDYQAVQRLREIEAEIEGRRKLNPLSFYEPLEIQELFEKDTNKTKLLFGGNRAGKTQGIAAYILRRCREKKIKAWATAESFSDSVNIQQRKIWELLPKFGLKYCKYNEITGFSNRKLLFDNGSLIIFKCLPRGSMVNMADGTWKDISHVDVGEYVYDVKGIERRVINKFKYEKSKLVEIKAKGHTVKCTPEHRFWVNNEWKEAKEIQSGDVLQVASFSGKEHIANWKPSVLALLIAEGCLVTDRSPDFTTISQEVIDKIKSVVPDDMQIKKISEKHAPYGYRLTSKHVVDNRIKQFLIDAKLWGKKAESKHIPNFVYKWNIEAQKEFIEMLFACDGSVTRLAAVYTTSSKKLAEDLQRLLWNFNVHPTIREVNSRDFRVEICAGQRKRFDCFNVVGKEIKYAPKHTKKHIKEGTVLSKLATKNKREVFCLEIEGSHEFIVNGFRTHNSYDQEREAFQGEDCDIIWNDEECPYDVYKEQRMRLIDRDGEMIISMTSLKGITDLLQEIFDGYEAKRVQYAPLLEKRLPRVAVKDDVSLYFLWTTENPYIDNSRVMQEAKLMTRQEIECRIYGMPVNLAGKIYMMFSRDVHVVSWGMIPREDMCIYNILDPHDRKPWAMNWIALHKTGTAYVIDEYPNRDFNEMLYDDKTYDDYAKIIKQKEADIKAVFGKGVYKRIIDPNFGNKTVQLAKRQGGQAHTTPKKELKRRGFSYADGIDALEAGHLEVRSWLYYEEKDGEIVVQPRLMFAEHCVNSIKHHSRYSRKDINSADGDEKDKVKPMDKYKDFPDLSRYFTMSNPQYVEGLRTVKMPEGRAY